MQKSKSALFLMELIIVILFFALTSAVCMRVFIKAHDVAHETESANYADFSSDETFEYMTFKFFYTPKSEEVYAYTFKRHKKEVS